MPKKKTSLHRNLLDAYSKYLVLNFVVTMKAPFELTTDRVNGVFAKAATTYPKMTADKFPEPGLPTDSEDADYRLSESLGSDTIRSLALYPKTLAIAAAHPLPIAEQLSTINNLAAVADGLNLIVPWAIDYVDFKFVFEVDYTGNHHAKVLDALFPSSCFHAVRQKTATTPTRFSPTMLLKHATDPALRFYIELRGQTNAREIESQKYDGDPIAVICSAVKVRGFSQGQTVREIYRHLENECYSQLLPACIDAMVVPLLSHSAG
jgi:hypothetical protein